MESHHHLWVPAYPHDCRPVLADTAEQKEDQPGGIPAHIPLCSASTAGFPSQKLLQLLQSS